jgi:nicotinamide-nucleotide amidase
MIINNLIKKIKKKGIFICAAESITGGKFTSEIVKKKGASSYLDFSIISYSNNSKSIFFGIEKQIEKYGVYSPEVAIKMSEKILLFSKKKNKLGISCTGLASKPQTQCDIKVGTIFIAVVYKKKKQVIKKEYFNRTRKEIINLAVNEMFKQIHLVV